LQVRDSDDDDDDIVVDGDDDDSAAIAIAMALAIDQSPGYVGCLVTKNTHRCSYDALSHAGTASQTGPACRKRAVPNRWNVGWMLDVYDVAYVGG
jgi:hypothetical protein